MKRRVLVVTPWIPYPITGADQQDRYQGFEQLQDSGNEIHVLAKIHAFQDRKEIVRFYHEVGIPITLIPYTTSHLKLLRDHAGQMLREPALLDGAALEYMDSVTVRAVEKAVRAFRPDVAWVEFSFLWPVIHQLHALGVPVVLRSANNEAQQSIDEHGGSLWSHITAIPKFRGEKIAARSADALCAITPLEEQWYKRCGAKNVSVLPLRGLPRILRQHVHRQKIRLEVVFLGSSYSNGHNRDALKFILTKIAPLMRVRAPHDFRFHITGKKFPEPFRRFVKGDIVVHDFIPEIDEFLDKMDIALCPSVSGQGMQQKIFEPLCCGLPLITNHTAGYPFENGENVLLAKTPRQYADHLLSLQSTSFRQELADKALWLSAKIFSQHGLEQIAVKAMEDAIARRSVMP